MSPFPEYDKEIHWEYITVWAFLQEYAGGGRFIAGKERLERYIEECSRRLAHPEPEEYLPRHSDEPVRRTKMTPEEIRSELQKAETALSKLVKEATGEANRDARNWLVPRINGQFDVKRCYRCKRNPAATAQLNSRQWFYTHDGECESCFRTRVRGAFGPRDD